jgi:hypothetical protein
VEKPAGEQHHGHPLPMRFEPAAAPSWQS